MIVPACVDKYLPKSGVWTTRGDAHNVVDMRYSVSQRRVDISTYILTKCSERNDDRQVSLSVEVEKMKIERSEAEGGNDSWLRAVAPFRSQSGKNDKGSEQRSWLS